MSSVDIGDVSVSYEIRGDGDPVLFLHARPFVVWYRPLLERLQGWLSISFRREVPDDPDFGIDADAGIAAGLVGHLGLQRPHLVGHSYGGLVALALARRPELEARSLALLEPATSGLLPPERAASLLEPMRELVGSHGPRAAMDAFLAAVCGESAPDVVEALIPGALDEAHDAAPGFFAREMAAVAAWRFGPDDAAAITCPVLNVRGSDSEPRFAMGADLIQSLLPDARPAVMTGVGHMSMAADPVAAAELLTEFWRSTT